MDDRIPTGHGVEDEAFVGARPDRSERRAHETLEAEAAAGGHEREAALQSVFEESHDVVPAASPGLRGPGSRCAHCGAELAGLLADAACPACGHAPPRGWAEWYLRRREATGAAASHGVALLLALLGGPLAVVGAFVTGDGPLLLVVFGPTAEEILKVGAVAFVVETRPYLLRGAAQIRLAVLASALFFAVAENLLYLEVRIPDPSELLVRWRWGACTALHLTASAIAAEGVVRAWRRADATLRKPDLAPLFPWLLGAIVLHGAYNGVAVLLELSGVAF